MPMLTPSQVHLDVPLTNLTLAYMQSMDNFVAARVFPVVNVDKQSDKYYIQDRAESNRAGPNLKLAPRTRPEREGMTISNDSYFSDVYAKATDFDEQTLANEDAALEIRVMQTSNLLNKMMINREKDFVTNYFSDNVWGTNWDGVANADNDTGIEVTNWDDYTNSTPIQDVTRLCRTVQLKSGGFKPNKGIMSKEVRDILINHPDILARLNGGATVTNTALVTDAKLAEIFGLQELMVLEAVENTAAEGATEANAFIGGNHFMVCYTPPSAGMRTAASGLIFAWNSLPGASFEGLTVESFTGDFLAVDGIAEEVHVKLSYDMKIVGADLGGFINSVIST